MGRYVLVFGRLRKDSLTVLSGSLEDRIGTLSLDKQEKIEADAVKAERKAEKKAELEQKKKEVSYVGSMA
jgi:hypothetical protein